LEELENRLVLSPGTLSVTAVPVVGQEQEPEYDLLARFTDSDASATVSDFTASVAWGDGNTTNEKVQSDNNGAYVVQGQGFHYYAEEGSYTFTVTISDTDTSQATATSTATISEGPLSVYISPIDNFIQLGENESVGLPETTIYHHDERKDTYAARIDWGDGTTSPGQVMDGRTVQGTHTYADERNYFVTVSVWEVENPSVVAQDGTFYKIFEEPLPGGEGEPNVRFIQEAYHDLLGRGPDPAALEWFSHELDLGMSRFQVALSLAGSAEYRSHQVDDTFGQYLHRQPTPAEEAQNISFPTAGGTVEQMAAQLAGSSEYLQKAGGTFDDFLSAFYQDALDRAVDSAGRAAFDQAAAAGATRADIALAILSSDEYKGDLVHGLYQRLLDRAPLPAEQTAWVAFLDQPGIPDETAIAGLTASDEFYSKPDVLTPTPQTLYLFRVFTDLLGRYPDSNEQIHYRQLLDTGESRLQIVMDIQATTEYCTRRLNALYQQYLQRDADPVGLDSGLRYLAAGGTMEHLAALIVGSPEILQKAGGTLDGLLDALYRDALGRTVDPAGRAAFDQASAAGMTPTDIAWAILNGDEYQSHVVQALYTRLLHRGATPDEQAAWIAYLRQGNSSESIVAALAASDEYYNVTKG
jgi:hypothetical protein